MNRLMICAWIETSRAATELVANDEARLDGKRARDADALPLAARELVRIAVSVDGVEPDHLHQVADIGVDFPAGDDAVNDRRLADDLAQRACAD